MGEKLNKILIFSIIGIVFLMSMGYSVLNSDLNVSGELTYKPSEDIRITNITQEALSNATIQYADFSKNEINLAYESTSAASVTLNIEVTNYTNTEMGILKIDNLPDNAIITGYTLKEKLKNSNGVLRAGDSTIFSITFNSTIAEIKSIILKFDFEPFYKVIYEGLENTSNYKTEILKGENFNQNIGIDTQVCNVTMNGIATGNYTFSNGVIEILNVIGDIVINGFIPVVEEITIPNAPVLNGDMIPVRYEQKTLTTGDWVKADVTNKDNDWYDYANQKWANAVTITSEKRDEIKKASAGTSIPIEAINTMWVWIPRYSYTIKSEDGENYYGKRTSCTVPSQELPGEIDIKFIKSTENYDTGNAQYTGKIASNWQTNEAFNFDGANEGIWVSKFELTGTQADRCENSNCSVTSLRSKPNEKALDWHDVDSFFYMIRSMQMNNADIFGFDKNNGDLHMIKNDEWGAVAYLSQSYYGKYGNDKYKEKNKQVYQNKSENNITGSSNGTPSQAEAIPQQYAYNDMTDLGEGQGQAGPGASTTGTIYGVYDMNGGEEEYVMAVLNNGSNKMELGETKFTEENIPDSKYYDLYTSLDTSTDNFYQAQVNKACNGKVCYGHALSEIYYDSNKITNPNEYGWYNNNESFVNKEKPWLIRGGDHWFWKAGIFMTNAFKGHGYPYTTRLVLTP